MTTPHPDLTITEEVADALADGTPVVALESTIISHGMPHPQNVEMATDVEQIIRDGGAVPATIAVIDGRPLIGLTGPDLELVATHPDVAKVSVRDLPYVMARGEHGATTVASTMRLAELAGISVFVTGGIGGVHRGAETTFDVSADLTELSKTNVAVVCAGVKSILDIGLTLEALETLGVPVVAYGTRDFPAFFSRVSGHRAPMSVDTPAELAQLMHAKWRLGLDGGLAFVNPIPVDDEIPAEEIGEIIEQALREMTSRGVHGKEATPFLLGRIVEITAGASLTANIALVKNNAHLGAHVACEFVAIDADAARGEDRARAGTRRRPAGSTGATERANTRTALVRRPDANLANGEVTHVERTPVDTALANRQWSDYVDALTANGWSIIEVPAAAGFADSVFIEDTVVVHGRSALVCRPGTDSRHGEVPAVHDQLERLGYRIGVVEAPGTLDGGDAMQVGSTIYIGNGGRTNLAGIEQARAFFAADGAMVVGVANTKVLHLKSAVTALPDGTVIGYEPVVEDPTVFPDFLAMPEEPGAHVVDLGDNRLLMAANCPGSQALLRDRGYEVVTVDIGEFEKLEGCVTCLSVRLRDLPPQA